jgi:16S rRNA (guanine527-N7)-methyltransferase
MFGSVVLPSVSRETLERFAELLLHWNRRLNLISRRDEAPLWERHIQDSLQLAELMAPLPERAIDIGSGAGFPGLVLAIATGVPFDLIEADQRKAAFLREAAHRLSAPVHVHSARAEALRLSPAPLVTARAVAPLPVLLGWAAPLLAPGGVCLFLKGARVDDELTAATAQWHIQVQQLPSRTPGGSILRITEPVRIQRSAQAAYTRHRQPKGGRRQDHDSDQPCNRHGCSR